MVGGKKGMECKKEKKWKERKSQGANGLMANQSWVMATLEWAGLTDGDHLSALALPWLPCLLTHRAGSAPTPRTPPPIMYMQHTYRDTLGPARLYQISQYIYCVRNGHIRGPHCFSWHGWVWMSAASVVHWFSIRIDWTKWALGSTAGDRTGGRWMSHNSGSHMVLLYTCAQWVERGETVPLLQDYCIKQQDAHFPHRCANPQHVDRNGPKDNEWRKKKGK